MWIFDALFGNPKNTETIVGAAVKGLDAVVFTDEEKSAANAEFREWYIKYLEATNPQNISRRIITIFVVALWTALVVLIAAAYPLSKDYSQFIFKLMTDVVATPFGLVLFFYFGAHAIRAIPSPKGGKE